TDDVDLLVTKPDLKLIHEKLDGLGYLPPFERSKQLRDTETRVKVEFLVTGGYPGDGKQKPISFPDPRDVSLEIDGVNYIKLPNLVELKLASGMSNLQRVKDIGDVISLIEAAALPLEFGEQLHPYVRDEYARLWAASRKRYITFWRPERLLAEQETLRAMLAEGVVMEPSRDPADPVRLVTTDPRIAEKYGLVDEYQYLDDEPNSSQ
ncbi:MAG TPA: hypothetical protein VGE52_07785, partial [Pirellulales bacterium]